MMLPKLIHLTKINGPIFTFVGLIKAKLIRIVDQYAVAMQVMKRNHLQVTWQTSLSPAPDKQLYLHFYRLFNY